MIGDILFKLQAGTGYQGDTSFQVEAGAVGTILAGEPVTKALGQQYVLPAATSTPIVGTDYMAGISATLSTDTVANDGTVSVAALVPGVIYLARPLTPSDYFGSGASPDQSVYDDQVGSRVLFDLTSGTYTITSADGSTHGLTVEDLDIGSYPGLVAFSIRAAVSYQA